MFDPSAAVFFMIGSQRSGSNWLRTMLGEREDLLGFHPPHIVREFAPGLAKFGDLSSTEANPQNLDILADHVLTFVERNQVQWTNKHMLPIKFNRKLCSSYARDQMLKLKLAHPAISLDDKLYLIAIFDYVYNTAATENDKRTWMCKSMGMSKYHDLLYLYYGKRLRYVYLVRDPRDVAMSFMKTPVGDCHYHAIVTKWVALQKLANAIQRAQPNIVHELRYEALVENKEKVIKELFEFIGDRRFGAIMRRGSVQALKTVEETVDSAKSSTESNKASGLSYQFKNLTRGNSFTKNQNQKWLTGGNGAVPLTTDELQLIESIAHETMDFLEYQTHVVNKTSQPTVFSAEVLEKYKRLNEEGISLMLETLEIENPDDAHRRIFQAEILGLPAVMLSKAADLDGDEDGDNGDKPLKHAAEDTVKTDKQKTMHYDWPFDARATGYLTDEQILGRLEAHEEETVTLKNGTRLRFAALTQRGYYPSQPDKANQDSFTVKKNIAGSANHLFSVYDGHGPKGDLCSQFARDHVVPQFEKSVEEDKLDVKSALTKAHLETNIMLFESTVDDSGSGSTATTLFIDENRGTMLIANIGDSRVMAGCVSEDGSTVEAKSLSMDQTPFRKDELERIKAAGGKVCTSDQLDGVSPMHEDWVDDGGDSQPPRIWSKDGKYPGTAFTRSIGDHTAEGLGVTAEVEFTEHQPTKRDKCYLVMSDGITEFISQADIVDIALSFTDPMEACKALVGLSYKRWIKNEDRTDDITVIVIYAEDEGQEAATVNELEVVCLDEIKIELVEEKGAEGGKLKAENAELKAENAELKAKLAVQMEELKELRAFREENSEFFQKYDLGAVLGTGAFSTVRVCTDKKSGEKFACKCIKKADMSEAEAAALIQENEIMLACEHKSIIKLYSCTEEKSYFYMVFETMAGGDLFDHIVKKKNYNELDARTTVFTMLSALKYLHSNNIAHRDLKPENLLLASMDDDVHVKLADFGFATRFKGEKSLNTKCGTPDYVAPEILKGLYYDESCDLWSAGVITYIVLAGYPPFYEDKEEDMFKKIMAGDWEFHEEFWGKVSDEAKDFVKGCLTLDVEKRLTVDSALTHPWLRIEGRRLTLTSLKSSQKNVTGLLAKRKLKGAVRAIMGTNRMKKLLGKK
jgi:calcium/calmodulin-dependent protein kinase I